MLAISTAQNSDVNPLSVNVQFKAGVENKAYNMLNQVYKQHVKPEI